LWSRKQCLSHCPLDELLTKGIIMKKAYELTDDEINKLGPVSRAEYERAIRLCKCENAGGPMGGWAHGFDALVNLGWTEGGHTVGHNTFKFWDKPTDLTKLSN
jgi:hypothetical protein